jgi:hypothetical protein
MLQIPPFLNNIYYLISITYRIISQHIFVAFALLLNKKVVDFLAIYPYIGMASLRNLSNRRYSNQ